MPDQETMQHSCETCKFYEYWRDEIYICGDYDGLYFHWQMSASDHCPDYDMKKTLRESD